MGTDGMKNRGRKALVVQIISTAPAVPLWTISTAPDDLYHIQNQIIVLVIIVFGNWTILFSVNRRLISVWRLFILISSFFSFILLFSRWRTYLSWSSLSLPSPAHVANIIRATSRHISFCDYAPIPRLSFILHSRGARARYWYASVIPLLATLLGNPRNADDVPTATSTPLRALKESKTHTRRRSAHQGTHLTRKEQQHHNKNHTELMRRLHVVSPYSFTCNYYSDTYRFFLRALKESKTHTRRRSAHQGTHLTRKEQQHHNKNHTELMRRLHVVSPYSFTCNYYSDTYRFFVTLAEVCLCRERSTRRELQHYKLHTTRKTKRKRENRRSATVCSKSTEHAHWAHRSYVCYMRGALPVVDTYFKMFTFQLWQSPEWT